MYASDLKHPLPTLEDKLHQLYALNRDKKIDLSFRPPYLDLLKAFGNPHLNLPPVIHVAGTNGKGSMIAIMKAILEAGGYKVHAYTSPHLQRFNERIYLAGAEIEDTPLEALIDEALELNNGGDVTFFEITTAMAFAAFSRTPADICLLEVGLGGRLDCTNVIEEPCATLIGSISRDHTEHLGESLAEIAAEKAGIMKTGTPCVIGPQNLEAIESGVFKVFESKAEEKEIKILRYAADWLIEPFEQNQMHQNMRFVFQGQEIILPMPSLEGAHQIENAGGALSVLKLIENQFPLNDDDYAQGLKNISWPARLQKLETGEIIKNVPAGWSVFLDGGHNEQAGHILAQTVSAWKENDAKDVHLILGMMANKEPVSFLKSLMPSVSSVTVIDIQDEPNAYDAKMLKGIIETNFEITRVRVAGSIEEAIESIITTSEQPGYILIAGSLYLAGHVLRTHGKTP